MASRTVHVRRVYDAVEDDDGVRVLVDRVWPRGMKKESARLDEWVKAVAPSTELRKWYGHDPDKFAEFRRHYRQELAEPEVEEAFGALRERAKSETITLLTAAKDLEHSQTRILADLLTGET